MKVPQTLEEFVPDERARYVPHFGVMTGGHRFILSPAGTGTRVDYELEMSPKGIFMLMTPMMAFMGRRKLRATAGALKAYLEGRPYPRQAQVRLLLELDDGLKRHRLEPIQRLPDATDAFAKSITRSPSLDGRWRVPRVDRDEEVALCLIT